MVHPFYSIRHTVHIEVFIAVQVHYTYQVPYYMNLALRLFFVGNPFGVRFATDKR